KQGMIYLIDRDHMGGYSPTTDNVVQELHGLPGVGSYDTPAFFFDGTTARIYYVAVFDRAHSFTIADGVLAADSSSPDLFSSTCATASISANDTSNGIAWYIDAGSGQLRAYDASNPSTEIWTSAQAPAGRDALGNAVKFSVPTIANGQVFVGGFNSLVVYGLLSTPTSPPESPADLTAAAVSGVQVNLAWNDLSNN